MSLYFFYLLLAILAFTSSNSFVISSDGASVIKLTTIIAIHATINAEIHIRIFLLSLYLLEKKSGIVIEFPAI